MKEDLHSFFEAGDFATLNGAARIHAIFGDPYIEAVGMDASDPRVICITEEVEHVRANDMLNICNIDYRVVGRGETERRGMTVLRLVKA